MCTAITLLTDHFYFGRTLDYDVVYPSAVTVMPRNFPLKFRESNQINRHYAVIGMASVEDNYPLYFDGINEAGLCMAGLNFEGYAVYGLSEGTGDRIAHFELIPWVLSQCRSAAEARSLLEKTVLTNISFREDIPPAKLHWLIADKTESIVLETTKEGVFLHENPVGVLTNNPTFDQQLFLLNNYMHLSPDTPDNHFSKKLDLRAYSRGMGLLGLPGDLSSQSRFVRAAFTKLNSVCGNSESESVSQFFHILATVEQVRGACRIAENQWEITQYTCCCSADQGIYYYTTYGNHQITAVDMYRTALDATRLICFPLISSEQILFQSI